MSTGAPAEVLSRLRQRCRMVQNDSLDNISAALTAPSSPLPAPLVAALSEEGALFVSSYAGAAPLLNALAPEHAHTMPKGAGTRSPTNSDGQTRASADSKSVLFTHFLCPPCSVALCSPGGGGGGVLEAVSAELSGTPWVRQVLSLLGPPVQAASSQAAPSSAAASPALQTTPDTAVGDETGHMVCHFIGKPVATVTAILDHGVLKLFPLNSTAGGGGSNPSTPGRRRSSRCVQEEQIWSAHVRKVSITEQRFYAALKAALHLSVASHTDTRTSTTQPQCTIEVPIYRTTVFALDAAGTRIATIGSLSNRILALMVRPSSVMPSAAEVEMEDNMTTDTAANKTSRLVHVNTIVLRVLVLCASAHTLARDGEARTRQEVAQAVHDVAHALLRILEAHEGNEFALWTAVSGAHLAGHTEEQEDAAHSSLQSLMTCLSRPPSVLVHCLQGVSRSPSVVLYYLMSRYTEVKDSAVVTSSSTAVVAEEAWGRPLSFAGLVDVVRSARPCVKPNFFFSAELATIWRHLTAA